MLGLDRGGACRGIAFRVAAAKRAETVAYLRSREQVTMVYREFVRPVRLKTSPERRGARALLHGRPQPSAIRRTVDARAAGPSRAPGTRQSGNNRDYVIATVSALEELGYRETELHLLAERLKGVHETHGAAARHPEVRATGAL